MNQKTTIYITRHGETEWNIEKRLQGHQNSSLTEKGVQQAVNLGKALEDIPIDMIYSSSSGRAVHTAALLTAKRQIPIYTSDAFIEMGLGIWEGLTHEEAKSLDQKQFDHFWNAPGEFQLKDAEKYDEVLQRALQELNRIVAKDEGKTILIVTHTVVIKVLMTYFEQRQLHKMWDLPYIHPTCLNKLVFENGQINIELHGDISHDELDGAQDLHSKEKSKGTVEVCGEIDFTIEEASAQEAAFIRDQLIQFNTKHVQGNYKNVKLAIKNEQGNIIAGTLGAVLWNWMEIDILWVDEAYRKHGLGSRLLKKMEKIAAANNCDFVQLNTFSFQAPEFYKKQGYEVFGIIEEAPRDNKHYYLKKVIGKL